MRQQQNSVLDFWWTTADHRRSRSFNFRCPSLFSIVYRLFVHLHHIGTTIYAVHSMGRHTRNCSKFRMEMKKKKKIENQQPRMDVTKSCWYVHAHCTLHTTLAIVDSCSSRVVFSPWVCWYILSNIRKKINLIFSCFCIYEFRVNERPTDEWQKINTKLFRHNVDAASRHHTDLYVFFQTESIITIHLS